jgi:hypothetical protein
MKMDTKAGLVLLVAFIIYLVIRACANPLTFFGSGFEKQTIHYYQRLLDVKKIGEVPKREEALHELATELGAGSIHWTIGTPVRLDEHATVIPSHDAMSEAELVNNIHYALQTRSSISSQRIAAQNNVIAFLAFLAVAAAGFIAYKALGRGI